MHIKGEGIVQAIASIIIKERSVEKMGYMGTEDKGEQFERDLAEVKALYREKSGKYSGVDLPENEAAARERKKQDFIELYWSNPEKYGKNAGHILEKDENGTWQMYSYDGKEYQGPFEDFLEKRRKRLEAFFEGEGRKMHISEAVEGV